jgi:Cysteine rich repeat
MPRFPFVIALVLIASPAFAQRDREHDACARDVARHCRAVMNDGDSAVLACLQQHRSRISKVCNKMLTDHGQ